MADDPSRAHPLAIYHMLRDGTGYQVHYGQVTAPGEELTYPHLVVWPAPGTRPTVTLAGYGGEVQTSTRVTAVGRDPDEVLATLDRVGVAVHRRAPQMPGRRASPVTQDGDGDVPDVQRDPAARTPDGRPLFFAALRFSMFSTPIEP